MKITPHINKLVVLHDTNGNQEQGSKDLLGLVICNEPFASFIQSCLRDTGAGRSRAVLAIPQKWAVSDFTGGTDVVQYTEAIPVAGFIGNNSWIDISDGRFVTEVDNRLIFETLTESKADIVVVNVVAHLRASYEKVLTTSRNDLVGFRLFYEDATQPAPFPDDWPHHLFIRADAVNKLSTQGSLPLNFSKFIQLCYSKSLVVQSIEMGGTALDLATAGGVRDLVQKRLASIDSSSHNSAGPQDVFIANSARLFGKTLLGRGVNIGENAIIAGPVIIGNGVNIGKDAVVRASVIGPGVSVGAGELIENSVLTQKTRQVDIRSSSRNLSHNNFRQFPKFSYAGWLKRLIDIVIAVIVLALFAPVIPIIMLAIKLTSPGPVFFMDMRQGLYGRAFNCLKFRTMKVGAERMQDRLRCLNQADGPQFTITDDPRVSAVGRFLRETYLDEIPQFINVLLGQMSVVGPRPSPEAENILCPFWRDARLSVRPGMTGLWQVCRTRQSMRDFQEWIHYDVKYVRDLSLKLDLWICWKTARKVAKKFFEQF